jgi:hypothetical protein
LPRHEARRDAEEEESIPEPPEGRIVSSLPPLLFPEEDPVEDVEGGPHGAEPPAKKIAEDHDEQKDAQGGKHPHDDLSISQKGNDSDERIDAQIEIDRDLQFQRESGLNDQIEKEEKGKDLNPSPQNGEGSGHVAVTFFN